MGNTRAEKANNHERIVRMAAARFRERGVAGIGVADLMREAGLTHGGFYRHFASRDALVGEAIECALRDGGRAVDALMSNRKATLDMFVDAYLSAAHRDDVATSCAVTTLAGDVARGNARERAAYARQVGKYVDLLVGLSAGGRGKSKRRKAIAALSTLVGAVSMARAVNDKRLSSEILAAAAAELKTADRKRG